METSSFKSIAWNSVICVGLLACGSWAAHAAAPAAAAAASSAADDSGLQEIVVTAEKFNSTVQNTPISLTALSGDQLAAAGITSIEDFIEQVPGFSMRSAGPGLTEYEARGLASNGGAAPTVGFYLDEIPLSPPALSQSGKVVIDPNLYDVERVEALRGPQGTLYGSGSMGGTIKVITNKPQLDTFAASVQGGWSNTEGGGSNWQGAGMVNLPLGSQFALRIVASDMYRSGWIDLTTLNPFPVSLKTTQFGCLTCAPVESSIPKANTEDLSVVRGELLYKPNENFYANLTAMQQRMGLGGYDLLDGTPTTSNPGAVYDAHYASFPFREGIHDDISIFGLTLVYNLGFADLTSATSYFERLGWQTQDASTSIYWTNNNVFNTAPTNQPLVAIPYSEVDPSHQFSEEIRLTSHDDGTLHWVGGAFYSYLKSTWQEESSNASVATPETPDGSFFTSQNPYTVKQFALFADGSWRFASQWKLAAGVRWYTYNSQQIEYSWGFDAPYPNQESVIPHTTTASNSGFNPRINLSYEPNDDLNVYATAAKGFRPGGANQLLPPPTQPPYCQGGATSFGPDSVWNYEVGEKARMFNNWLTVNGDVYYIQWNGVQQVITLPCGYQYYDNAGNGHTYGPEIEINAKLSQNWLLSLSGTYTEAKITSPNAAYTSYLTQIAYQPNGVTPACASASSCTAPIMNVPNYTASGSITYTTTFAGDYEFAARVDDSIVGDTHDVAYYFNYILPAYNIANARVTVTHGNLSGNVFIDNFMNTVALISANNTSFQFNIPQLVRYSTNQPRTFGLQLNYKF